MFYFEGPESLKPYHDSSQDKFKQILSFERLLLNKFPTFFFFFQYFFLIRNLFSIPTLCFILLHL